MANGNSEEANGPITIVDNLQPGHDILWDTFTIDGLPISQFENNGTATFTQIGANAFNLVLQPALVDHVYATINYQTRINETEMQFNDLRNDFTMAYGDPSDPQTINDTGTVTNIANSGGESEADVTQAKTEAIDDMTSTANSTIDNINADNSLTAAQKQDLTE
ncbi:hypothetical protein MOO45_01655 [Bombilactobacillus folatiphilus]|uniref:Uncharacterized protein n=1 Tax=Bombilactobacillus folatiphilus TaxID=2923362 RepID=A0ABY4PA44_9LACO|nr:hypothetical protein [Bombilactobacillus folatiphilus]UQS82419.1 hypothetical protein MOO45_01655 [Bombilactobacillus folatiphilus]